MGSATTTAERGRLPAATVTTLAVMAVTVAAIVLILTLAGELLMPAVQVAVATALGAIQLVLAAIVARAAPGNPAAPLLAAEGLVIVVTNSLNLDPEGTFGGGWMLLFLPLAILLLIVPTGHPASRRWRVVGWTLVAVVVVFMSAVAAQAVWPVAAGVVTVIGFAVLPLFLGLLIACAAAPIARYRRADDLERLRLRWVMVGGVSLPLTLLLCWTSYLVLGAPDLVAFGLILMFLAIPAGVAIAVTRPRLFDIDRAAVATVSAVGLAMVVLVVLTIASAGVGLAMIDWSPFAALTTTAALVAASVIAFPFVRRGLDRMLYPERGRTIAALNRLGANVEAGTATPEEVQQTLRTALRDPGLQVAYLRLADRALVTYDDRPVEVGPSSVAVHLHDEEVGAIVPSAARAVRPAAMVVRAAAPLIEAARMRAELARATAEVASSRERMLRAGYDERRRLERDLHDGAQQRLVALGMQLRVLQRGADADGAVAASLDEAVAQLGTAIAELRQLAHGVRPSALDDGLGAALAELEHLSPQTVELDVRAGELPDVVATTAYYIVSEAVANALRHAEASRIVVRVRETDDALLVRVSDDGRGGAVPRSTGGLTGLSDRVSALGGRLTVDSAQGTGTIVEASIPCGS